MAVATNTCFSKNITICPIQISQNPVARFTCPPNMCINTPITFTNTSDPGCNINGSVSDNHTDFIWYFGDGQTQYYYNIANNAIGSASPTHTYGSAGVFVVKLVAQNTGIGMCIDSTIYTKTICISPVPIPLFSVDKTTDCVPFSVIATNTSPTPNTCSDRTFTWSVTKNNSLQCLPSDQNYTIVLNGDNAAFTFLDPGDYNIILNVKNSCAPSGIIKSQQIIAKTVPRGSINNISDICQVGVITPFATFQTCFDPILEYQWTFVGGNPSTSTTNPPGPINYLNPGTYTVKVKARNICGWSTEFISNPFSVKPIAYIPNQTPIICSGAMFTITPANNPPSTIVPAGTTYSWGTPTGTGFSGGSSGINQPSISGTLINTTNITQTATYTVTPSTGGCPGASFSIIVNITPKPVIPNQTPSICSGGTFSINPINSPPLTIVPAGTSYNWNAPTGIGFTGGLPGINQSSISGTLTNTTNSAQTAVYTVTPNYAGCPGTPFTISVIINPVPLIPTQPASICSGLPFSVTPVNAPPTAIVPAGTTYSWGTPAGTGFTGGATGTNQTTIAGTLSNSTNTSQSANYTVTPTAASCPGTTFSVPVTINPKPVIPAQSATICSGGSFIISPVDAAPATIVPSGTTYSWGAPSGTGFSGGAAGTSQASITGSLINTTNAVQTATYSVTPTSGASGNCVGTPFSIAVTINPKPVIPNQTASICIGNSFSLSLTNNPPSTLIPSGTTYTWGVPVVTGGVTGGAGGTNQTVISGTLTNPTSTTQTATYTIIPLSGAQGNCPGTPFTLVVTLSPTPQIQAQSGTICSGASFTISPADAPPTTIVPTGTTYSWSTPSGSGFSGGAAGTSQASITGTLTNTTNSSQTATYTVTPSSGGCPGASFNVTVNINPKPVIPNQTPSICSGGSFTFTPVNTPPLTIVPTGTTYTWSAPSGSGFTGGTSGASQPSVTGTLDNTTNSSQTAIYTVTPTSGASGNCIGNPLTITVTINPVPLIPTQPATICSGLPFSVTPVNAPPTTIVPVGTTYSWGIPAGTGFTGGAIGTNQTTVTGVLTNTMGTIQTATYTIIPISGTCPGAGFSIPVTINPLPVANAGIDKTINYGMFSTLSGVASGGSNTGYTYLWSPAGNIATATNLPTITTTALTVNPSIFSLKVTDSEGCEGLDQVTVNVSGSALAVSISAIPQIICNTGASVQLGAIATGGNSAVSISYSWTSVPVGFTSTLQNPVVTPIINTTYIVTVDDGFNTATNSISVTVNQLPAVFDITGGGEYCAGGAGVPIGLSNSQSGISYQLYMQPTPTPIGTPVSGTGAPITFGNKTQAGTYYIKATNTTTNCSQDMNGTAAIVINPLPIANAGIDKTINFGTSTTLTGSVSSGTPGFTYLWSPAANINGLPNTASVLTQNLTTNPSVFVFLVTDSKSCSNSDQVVINLNGSALAVAISATPQVICNIGTNVQLSATASGGNSAVSLSYSWTSSPAGFSSTLQNPIANPTVTTIYTVTVNDGFNIATNSVTITVNPLPTLFNVTGGGEYCALGSGVPVGLSGSETGINYDLLLNGTIPSGTAIGTGSPISFGNKTAAGLYTVKATNTTTSCWQNMTGNVPIAINPLPVIDAGTDKVIPFGISTTLSGSATGGTGTLTYSWTPAANINTGGTTLTPGTTNLYTSTSFTLLVTDSKGCTSSDNVMVNLSGSALSVTVAATPNEICVGETSQLLATGAGGSGTYTYSWTSIPPGSPPWTSTLSNPVVSPFANTAYTVTVNDGYNTATASVNIVVNPLPVQYPVTGGGPYCSGGSGVPVGVQNSQNGVVYRLYRNQTQVGLPVDGNGGAISFGNQLAAGNYFVKGTRTLTGCLNIMTDSAIVTILPLPDQYLVTGGGSYPSGGNGVPIGLSNSQTGVEYELSTGTTIISPRVQGTGSPITFGLQTGAGNYIVTAFSLTNPVCSSQMQGSSTVVINPWPTVFAMFGGGAICADDSTGVQIGIDGSEVGVSYQLKRDGANIGGPVQGTGDSIYFGYYTHGVVYTVTGTNNQTLLSKPMSGSATVIINPLPIAFVMGSYGDNCPGSEIMLNGSQLGVNYVLRLNLNAVKTLPGTGNVLNFGPQMSPGVYSIYAYFVVTGCDTIMDNPITINPSPNVYFVKPPGVSCADDTISITGSQLGIIYQLQRNSFTNVGSPLPGTGLPISFGSQPVPGIYKVLAINPLTNCKIFMDGSASLNPLPNPFTVVPSGDTCAGVSIGLSGSQLGIRYILKRDTLWIDSINGTGNPIEFGSQTIPGIYTIMGYDTITYKFCGNLMAGSTVIKPNPILYSIEPSGFHCTGDLIGLSLSQTGVFYQLIRNNTQSIGSPLAGTGGPISFGPQNQSGTYTVIARNTTTHCWSQMNGSAILTPLPALYSINPAGDTCSGAVIHLNGSQAGVRYTLFRDNVPVNELTGTGGILTFGQQTIAGIYTIRGYNTGSDSCIALMTGTTNILPGPHQYTIQPLGISCAGSLIQLPGSEPGVDYQLIRNTNQLIGSPIPGTGSAISFGTQSLPGTYTITGTNSAGHCWSIMIGSALISTPPSTFRITPDADTCSNTAIGLNGSQSGVTYTLFRDLTYPVSVVHGTGNPISFGPQALAGYYTVKAINNAADSCSAMMQGAVALRPAPVAYPIVPSGVICAGSTLGLESSQSGVSYTLYRDNSLVGNMAGTGGALDFGSQTFPGTYTIIGVDPITHCWTQMNGTTVLHPAPAAYSMVPVGDTCEHTTIILNGSQPGVRYLLKRDQVTVESRQGTGQPIIFNAAAYAGIYTILAVNLSSDSCSALMNGSLIIHSLPEAYAVTPAGANCEPAIIGLSSSQSGVSYELFKNGLTTGLILAGTGSPLNFPPQNAGLYTITGRLTSSPFCNNQMSDTAVVSSKPIVDAGPDDTICASVISYTLHATALHYSSLHWSTSGDGTFANAATTTPAYTLGTMDKQNGMVILTITADATEQCPGNTVSDGLTLRVDPRPVAQAGPDQDICKNQTVQLNATALHFGTVLWNSTGDGAFNDNSILNPVYSPGLADIQNATVKLILTASGKDNCYAEKDRDTLNISIFPLPSAMISGNVTICEHDTASIQVALTGTPPWSVSYTNGLSTSTVDNIGTSPWIFQVSPFVTTSYSLVGITDAHCDGTALTGTAMITVHPKPFSFNMTVTNDGSYCEGGTGVNIGLTGSQTGVIYKLFLGGIQVTNSIAGTGLPMQFGIQTTPGIYTVLAVDTTTLNNCSRPISDSVIVTVNPLPVVDFRTDSTCLGSFTRFIITGQDTSHIALWNWDFGDGTTTAFNYFNEPTHLFPVTGDYMVTLNVTDTHGCQRQIIHAVHVIPLPVALFSSSSPACKNTTISFADYSYSLPAQTTYLSKWIWNFGDGVTDTIHFPSSADVQHQYTVPGTYQVKLTVANNRGCTNEKTIPVSVTPAPVANFTYGAQQCEDQLLQFSDNSQTAGGGNLISWTWNFGDPISGVNNTSIEQSPSHQFSAAGHYYVRLKIQSSQGCLDSIEKPIDVQLKPIANFLTDSTCFGSPTTFISNSSANASSISTYEWNFGDGSLHTFGPGPLIHLYNLSGTYNATLRITNSNGCIHDTTKQVFVYPPPVAEFTAVAGQCQNTPVAFSNLSYPVHGHIIRWRWDFGDGDSTIISFPANPNVQHTYLTTGTFLAKLTVKTDDSCSASRTQPITITPKPVANFTNSTIDCSSSLVDFLDLSQTNGGSSITQWNWLFNDPVSGANNTSTLQNPSHAFTQPIPYNVRLIIHNVNSCADTIIKTVSINTPPTAQFVFDTACFGSLTQFHDLSIPNTGILTSWDWNFGDGSAHALVADPTHLYTAPGTYVVTLTVMNSNNCSKEISKSIMVLPSPLASFLYSSANCAGGPVQFTNQSTTPYSYIAKWFWEFGDGSSTLVSLPPPQFVYHTYASPGTYAVRLTVKTADSCSSFVIHTVTVTPKPMANFDYATTRCEKATVQFTDISQPNGTTSIVSWEWNFGDPASGLNNSSIAQNPQHIFNTSGTDTVRLVVTNVNNCRDTIRKLIDIKPAPAARFNFTNACLGTLTHFTDISVANSGTISSWAWNFGDGGTSTLQNPTHLYTFAGTYPVILHVTNSAGCQKDTTESVPVLVAPTAMFNHTGHCQGSGTSFTDISTTPSGTINQWSWSFGDGGSSILQNPTHVFTNFGTFNVRLVVTNANGCNDSIVLPVTIHQRPNAQYAYFNTFCPQGKVSFSDQSTAISTSITNWYWTFEPGYNSINQNPVYQYSHTDSTYAVSLIVTDGNGCKDTIVDSVFVKPGFHVRVLADTACFGKPTHFQAVNLAPGDPLHEFSWTFGEPASTTNTSMLQDPTHTYALPGTYMVKLKALNTDNCIDSTYKNVLVMPGATAQFDLKPDLCDSTVHFINLSSGNGYPLDSLRWNFGDNTYLSLSAPIIIGDTITHKYPNYSVFNVTLEVFTSHGCTDSITRQAPVTCLTSGFTLTDTTCARAPISIADIATPKPIINQWFWEFGDGKDTTYTHYCASLTHAFHDPGVYSVMQKVKTLFGGIAVFDSSFTTILVKPSPTAAFSIINQPICFNDSAKFTATHFNGDTITSYFWKFGDPTSGVNNSDTAHNTSHLYTHAGTFHPKLILNNTVGCRDSVSSTVAVHALPNARFSMPALICSRTNIQFTDQSDTIVNAWSWYFSGSGYPTSVSALQDPVVSYDHPGKYSAKLQVTDRFGCKDTVSHSLTVENSPISSFTVTKDVDGVTGKIQVKNTSSGANAYLWDFKNGVTSTLFNPDVVVYKDTGTYLIHLVAYTDADVMAEQCTDTSYYQLSVEFQGLFVPNAFAPTFGNFNTNGEVRLFKPAGTGLLKYHLQVFDTWGRLLWESTKLNSHDEPEEGWNGKYNDVPMPQGNYIWKISATFKDGTEWAGCTNGKSGSTKNTMGSVVLIR